MAPVVSNISNEIQNGDILLLVNPDSPWKMAVRMEWEIYYEMA